MSKSQKKMPTCYWEWMFLLHPQNWKSCWNEDISRLSRHMHTRHSDFVVECLLIQFISNSLRWMRGEEFIGSPILLIPSLISFHSLASSLTVLLRDAPNIRKGPLSADILLLVDKKCLRFSKVTNDGFGSDSWIDFSSLHNAAKWKDL